jgi:spermidine synthase
MLPIVTIAAARLPDGTEFVLQRRGEEWMVRAGAQLLMSSRSHESENELAAQALIRVANPSRILVAGLGLGFTLRAVLDRVGATTRVAVAELVPELLGWNEQHVGALASHPLRDPRCDVIVGDVFETIQASKHEFDALLLDVDNGPAAVSHDRNKRLYTPHGIAACRRALRPAGVLALWSAGVDQRYQSDLERAGFVVEVVKVRATRSGKAQHIIFVAIAR